MEKIFLLQLVEGLKPTYENSILELEQLKKYIKCASKKVEDYKLIFWQCDSLLYGIEKPELVILYKIANAEFDKSLSPAMNSFIVQGGGNMGYFYRNLNNKYVIKGKYDTWVFNHQNFHDALEKQIDSDFYKNIYKTIETEYRHVDIKSHGISYGSCGIFNYFSGSNHIFINAMSDEELQEPIIQLDQLNDYQRKAVVSNLRIYYPFEIIRNNSDSNYFEVKEEKGKTIILQK